MLRPDCSKSPLLLHLYPTLIGQKPLPKAYSLLSDNAGKTTHEAAEAARKAEQDFHNAVLAMKEAVKGQFGSDGKEAVTIGLKRKSDRKLPTRKSKETAVR